MNTPTARPKYSRPARDVDACPPEARTHEMLRSVNHQRWERIGGSNRIEICPVCGEEYYNETGEKQTCGAALCRGRVWFVKHGLPIGFWRACKRCGKEFYVKPHQAGTHWYCGMKCSAQALGEKLALRPGDETNSYKCSDCKIIKPTSEFGVGHHNRNGVAIPKSRCKVCEAVYQRQWRLKTRPNASADRVNRKPGEGSFNRLGRPVKQWNGHQKTILQIAYLRVHGSIPEGCTIFPVDGDWFNDAYDNLYVISLAEVGRANSLKKSAQERHESGCADGEKYCSKCGKIKSITEFYTRRYPTGTSGHAAHCKECMDARCRAYESKRERNRSEDRKRTLVRKAIRAARKER